MRDRAGAAEIRFLDHYAPRGFSPILKVVDDDLRRAIVDADLYSPHRDKFGEVGARGLALVARPVKPKQTKLNPKAQAALDVEYNALRNDWKAWDGRG